MQKTKRRIFATVSLLFIFSQTALPFDSVKLCLKISLPLSPSVVIRAAIGDLFCQLYQRNSSFLSSHLFEHSYFLVLINRGIAGQTKLVPDLTCIMNGVFSSAIILNLLFKLLDMTFYHKYSFTGD